MSYNSNLPVDNTADIRENFRALKEDKIVAAASATTADSATTAEDCTGNAATATKLETARAINGVAFDGTADITITEVDGKTIATTDKISNAFSNVLVNGTTIQADSQTDTIKLEAGTNILLTADTTNEKVTIAITGQVASAVRADSATIADTATKLVTAHTINGVAFDGSADITITAEADGGTADTATKLATAKTISLTGDATGSAIFDGSADVSITVDVTSADTATICAGNAATATKLETTRTINGVSFDGSANIAITTANGGTIATTDQVTAAAAHGKKLFTASGTFTVPTGVTQVWVSLCGGGGNGGAGYYNDELAAGAGGGAGAAKLAESVTGLTSGETVLVTVGGVSGTSSFGSYVSCAGGKTGAIGNNSYSSLGGASGGTGGTSGDSVWGFPKGGAGGGGIFGAGGKGGTYNRMAGGDGGGYGAGGGGGHYGYAGGAGTSGMVLVEW